MLVSDRFATARMHFLACFCDGSACIDTVALASFTSANGFLYAALFYFCCVFAVCSLHFGLFVCLLACAS